MVFHGEKPSKQSTPAQNSILSNPHFKEATSKLVTGMVDGLGMYPEAELGKILKLINKAVETL